jgi:hypothetical protein
MILLLLFCVFVSVACFIGDPFRELEIGAKITNKTMSKIARDWDFERYPLFLQSCFLHKTSWDLLKQKFAQRILSAFRRGPQLFIVSFMGSGVTAGYDNIQMDVFTNIVQDIMQPVMSTLNIRFESRNVAIASNPSLPYAMCSPTFAGNDVDILNWEFTYDCGYPECGFIMEQFLRQSLLIPSHPVVALAFSHSAHW